MNKHINIRFVGVLFIILASLGILFSLSGITITWLIRPKVQHGLMGLVIAADDTIVTTSDTLKVLEKTIDNTVVSLNQIDSTLENLDSTIESISASLETSAVLVGDDLRLTVIDTQIALSSAATSSKFIDDTLSFLATIPLLGIDYRPDVPLHISLAQVATSMDDFPDALLNIQENLNDSVYGVNTMKDDLSELKENVVEVEDDLREAQLILNDYSTIIERVQQQVSTFRDNLPLYVTLVSVFISGLLFWLGITQVLFLVQGLVYKQGEQLVVSLAEEPKE